MTAQAHQVKKGGTELAGLEELDVELGPTGRPLTHFAVSVDAMGNITIEGGKQVGASVRTAVA